MTPAQVAALGVVQGIAEVVPVSSSAQLTLLPWLLRWDAMYPAETDRTTFAAGLHAGSCAGLALAHRGDLGGMRPATAGKLALATLPAAAVGYLAQDAVERRLGGPGSTAFFLGTGGLLMLAADRQAADRQVGVREAALAGLTQVAALAPGVSRSGAALTALRALRVDRDEAARFSVLMSLPVTAGGALLTAARARRLPPVVPAVAAGVSAAQLAARVPSGSRQVVVLSALYRLGIAAAVAARLRSQGRERT